MDYKKAALAFIERGWHVFPLTPATKLPVAGSKGLSDSSNDIEAVEAWWAFNPRYNIGLRCGVCSELFVLDIDPRHGGDNTIKRLQEQHGRLPKTVTVKTGGGGWQLYFKLPYIHGVPLNNSSNKIGLRFATHKDPRGRPISGIDTRGEGGYVVAPPSLHPDTKEHYVWAEGREPGSVELADCPAWIIGELEGRFDNPDGEAINDPTAKGAGRPFGTSKGAAPQGVARHDFFRDLFAQGAPSGARNDSMARMAGYFLRARIDPLLVLDLLQLWNKARNYPPMSEAEVEKTVNSVAGNEIKRIESRAQRGRVRRRRGSEMPEETAPEGFPQ